MARDPVCGMEVSESQAAASLEYQGRGYYFCALSCYDAFNKNPDKYVAGNGKNWWTRFLNSIARANRETYGSKAPKCH